jgi:hypothetical protein
LSDDVADPHTNPPKPSNVAPLQHGNRLEKAKEEKSWALRQPADERHSLMPRYAKNAGLSADLLVPNSLVADAKRAEQRLCRAPPHRCAREISYPRRIS